MRSARLRDLAEVNPPTPEFESIDDDGLVTFMPLEAVWPDERIDLTRSRPKSEVATGYVRFRSGDVLCPKVTPTFQAGRSALIPSLANNVGAASTEVHVIRARPEVAEPRFLRYRLLAKDFLDEGTANFQGVAGLQRVPAEFLKDLEVLAMTLDRQRTVADFLDDQAACIDKVIRTRAEEAALLEGSGGVLLAEATRKYGVVFPPALSDSFRDLPEGWHVAELAHILQQLTNGYVGPTRDILVDSGVPYIQSLHIKNGAIDFTRAEFYVTEPWHRERPRINLKSGDVLIVQTGDIGQVAVVPDNFGEASCHALQIARVERRVVDSQYLGEYLRSDFGRHQLLSRATGALHPHLEAGIKSIPVLLPPLDIQRALVRQVTASRQRLEMAATEIHRSVTLLSEYKRSLITAAVTGEMDVATARRGIPA